VNVADLTAALKQHYGPFNIPSRVCVEFGAAAENVYQYVLQRYGKAGENSWTYLLQVFEYCGHTHQTLGGRVPDLIENEKNFETNPGLKACRSIVGLINTLGFEKTRLLITPAPYNKESYMKFEFPHLEDLIKQYEAKIVELETRIEELAE